MERLNNVSNEEHSTLLVVPYLTFLQKSFGFSSGGSGLGSSASEGAVTCAECQNNVG